MIESKWPHERTVAITESEGWVNLYEGVRVNGVDTLVHLSWHSVQTGGKWFCSGNSIRTPKGHTTPSDAIAEWKNDYSTLIGQPSLF